MMTHKRRILYLVSISLMMFGFSFALVPLYNTLCRITGLNGKVSTKQDLLAAQGVQNPEHIPGSTRYQNLHYRPARKAIQVEMDSTRNQQLPCVLTPEHRILEVIPGTLITTSFRAKNLSAKHLHIQAIPSISPGAAAQYLKKLECFCFNQQIIKPGEEITLPLRFWLEPEIPENIHRLTLSYTLFEITGSNRAS